MIKQFFGKWADWKDLRKRAASVALLDFEIPRQKGFLRIRPCLTFPVGIKAQFPDCIQDMKDTNK